MNIVVGRIGIDDLQWLLGLNPEDARYVFAAPLIERNGGGGNFERSLGQPAFDVNENILQFTVADGHIVNKGLSHFFAGRVLAQIQLARRGSLALKRNYAGDIAFIARRLPERPGWN